ncbi:N-acetylmuramoyl-L-alanine amidase [Fodinicola feengrottensis]|uniref:N-acetylmuramoyl-L-alanine amidase n=1 Tax=Fodinicola feengrottensis TaxID=435914 RepID=UPI0024415558|nr:peptidoglycan recognition family protein [Fodinicola feengrottensis]
MGRYSSATTTAGAKEFADQVFDLIRTGMSRQTVDGQQVTLAAAPGVSPATGQLAALHLSAPAAGTTQPDCPSTLDCDFIPAAYQQTGTSKEAYGNYDLANRPSTSKIQYIVIHDQEGYYNGTVSWFQNPAAQATSNYVMRSSDGHITQMVPTKDVAWHAGNWYVNTHSIGIEHEGFAAAGATWYTEAMYRQSAKLVRYLAQRFNIPLDRQHIIGHGNVPGLSTNKIRGMHWDPGPFWDWNHYLDLLHATPRQDRHGGLLTIAPNFATQQLPVSGCDTSGSGTPCAAQGSNFVYLRTSPSADAPLVTDVGLHAGPATTDIADWGARAEAGQQFVGGGAVRRLERDLVPRPKSLVPEPAQHPNGVLVGRLRNHPAARPGQHPGLRQGISRSGRVQRQSRTGPARRRPRLHDRGRPALHPRRVASVDGLLLRPRQSTRRIPATTPSSPATPATWRSSTTTASRSYAPRTYRCCRRSLSDLPCGKVWAPRLFHRLVSAAAFPHFFLQELVVLC